MARKNDDDIEGLGLPNSRGNLHDRPDLGIEIGQVQQNERNSSAQDSSPRPGTFKLDIVTYLTNANIPHTVNPSLPLVMM